MTFVANLTPYAREEWVRFGASLPGPGEPLKIFPRHAFHAAKVRVPAFFVGVVPEQRIAAGDVFVLHPRIKAATLFAAVNGELKQLKLVRVECDSPGVKGMLWSGRFKDGTFELETYTYSGQPTITFEAFFAAESLNAQLITIDLAFGCLEAKTLAYGHAPAAEGQGVTLLAQQEMGDTQGAAWYGQLFFGFDNEAEQQTVMAQALKPLFGQDDLWTTWGIWGQPPALMPQIERGRHFADIYRRHENLKDPLAHLGMIGPGYGRTTGDHATFGWRHHNEALAGGSPVMWEEYAACMREACRPGWYFEADGDFVRKDRRPQWHTWDGSTHYHPGVSPDRLGRAHPTWVQQYWSGYDWQHFGYVPWLENGILNGSFMMLRRLEQLTEVWLAGATLPSMVGQSSLNDPGTGREVGRMAQVFAQSYLASGDRRLVDRGVARFHEVVRPRWLSHFKAGDKIKPYTIVPAGGKAYPDRDAVIVWEDGLAAVGLDALAEVSGDAAIREMVIEIGSWIARYGYYPDGTHMLGGFAVTPGNEPPDHNDPENTWSDAGTDYKNWCRAAVELAYKHAVAVGDNELAARCDLILTRIPLSAARWGGVVPPRNPT